MGVQVHLRIDQCPSQLLGAVGGAPFSQLVSEVFGVVIRQGHRVLSALFFAKPFSPFPVADSWSEARRATRLLTQRFGPTRCFQPEPLHGDDALSPRNRACRARRLSLRRALSYWLSPRRDERPQSRGKQSDRRKRRGRWRSKGHPYRSDHLSLMAAASWSHPTAANSCSIKSRKTSALMTCVAPSLMKTSRTPLGRFGTRQATTRGRGRCSDTRRRGCPT